MIHREGIKISILVFAVLLVLNCLLFFFVGQAFLSWFVLMVSLLFMVFILRFFRNPGRTISASPGMVYAPADGKVVVVEETEEGEYLKGLVIQVD